MKKLNVLVAAVMLVSATEAWANMTLTQTYASGGSCGYEMPCIKGQLYPSKQDCSGAKPDICPTSPMEGCTMTQQDACP